MLNELYQSLNPVAIQLGPVVIRWYALAYLAGFVLAGLVVYRVARRWGFDVSGEEVVTVVVGVAWGVIIGARLFYVIFYGDGYYLAHPLDVFMLSEGGMSFHGGLVGAVMGGCIACRACKLSIPTMCDLGAIAAPLGLFFGRCANFVNGELWGKPTDRHDGPAALAAARGGGRGRARVVEAYAPAAGVARLTRMSARLTRTRRIFRCLAAACTIRSACELRAP